MKLAPPLDSVAIAAAACPVIAAALDHLKERFSHLKSELAKLWRTAPEGYLKSLVHVPSK